MTETPNTDHGPAYELVPLTVDGPLYDPVLAVYETTFPGDEASIRQHSEQPGFQGLVAVDEQDEVLGFVYGYTATPGEWWRERITEAIGPERTARWLADCFEFVELAVAPEARRTGIGTHLHDAVLSGLSHETSVLLTAIDNGPARTLYANRGWQILHEPFDPTPEGDPKVIMGIDIPVSSADA